MLEEFERTKIMKLEIKGGMEGDPMGVLLKALRVVLKKLGIEYRDLELITESERQGVQLLECSISEEGLNELLRELPRGTKVIPNWVSEKKPSVALNPIFVPPNTNAERKEKHTQTS